MQNRSLYITLLFLFFALSSYAQTYPVPPKTPELLFYIQRNHNANTIVYDAQYDNQGMLKKDKPIVAYWIRYEEEGQKMDLRRIERWYAYGVNCNPIKDAPDNYALKLAADKRRELILKQKAPFEAYVYTQIQDTNCVLDHLYIQADNSGLWPTVEYIELFGKDTAIVDKQYYQKILIQ